MSGATIAIIDDDILTREYMTCSAKKQGFRIAEAVKCAESAIAQLLARAKTIDVFLVDYRLDPIPHDGIELCRQLREANPEAVIALMTSRRSQIPEEEMKEVIRQGIVDRILDKEPLEQMDTMLREFAEKASDSSSMTDIVFVDRAKMLRVGLALSTLLMVASSASGWILLLSAPLTAVTFIFFGVICSLSFLILLQKQAGHVFVPHNNLSVILRIACIFFVEYLAILLFLCGLRLCG